MKLKEYWPSFREARKMRRLPIESLHEQRAAVPVIVTLTSIPSRLDKLDITIRSILNQSRKPEKVVLWLHRDLQSELPASLLSLLGPAFEIEYVDGFSSHRKLVHSLEKYPEHVLVTCDDDLIYPQDWLERLYADHQQHPDCILCHECRLIGYDESGALQPYTQWPTVNEPGVEARNLLPIGYGGVLYPPGALDAQVTDSQLYLGLTPRADDLWFRMMSYLKGTRVRRTSSPRPKPMPTIGSQKVSLLKTNVREDGNRLQWQALCDHFGLGADDFI